MNEKDVLNEEYNILQSHYFNCIYSNYFAFANRFSCDLTLCKTVGEHLRGNLQDQYSNIIVEVLTLTDRILPFISMLIQWEILHTNNKENLLRGNNLCTKVVTYYLKRTLRGFARKVLTPHITEIIETNKSYEIDKITLGNTIDQSIIKENQNNLKCISIKIIDSLVQNVHQFPKEANTICNLIWTSLQGKYPEDAKLPSQLVGGILFLRVLCSFIATPDTNNLLLPGTKLIPSSRRKLILVSKTLQAISNVSTNSFDSVLEQMKEVLIQQIPRLHELYRIVSLDSTILPINDLVSKDIPLRQCDINIFFSLHYLFNQAKENHLTSNQNRTELRLSLNPKYSNSMAQIDFNQIKEEDAKISSSSVRKRVFPLKTPQRIEKSNDLFSLDVKPIKKKDLSLCKIENTEEKSNENQQNDLPPFLLQKPSSPKPLQEPSKRRSYRRSLYGGTIDIDSSYKDLSNLIGPTPFEPIKSFKKIVEWEIPEIDEDIQNEFIKKLYESCFYRSMLDNNCLIVYAENISIKKGKKVIGNSCILMICLDSFIVKKGNEIELSIGFAAIERVSVLPYNDLTSKIQICYKDVKDPLLNSTIKEWLIEKKNEQIREKLNYMIEKFNETKNQM
ncbi:gtpaseactivator protein for Ras family gtpase [Entamoeba histolytica KU27]|uniref:Gtpaseactivator protein for Ras family gtpase n=1 Tax=Entamoeba histolytica KU27 TaxID=885311 RepID=M2S7H7_ENTHI|nr:gtpaseactivator protein for Ras family gtpase [Entamoeba histolytica KU27]